MTDNGQFVDIEKLGRLGLRRPGHAGQLVIHPEVVLDGDGGIGPGLPLDGDPFLGLDRLVQAVAPTPARHDAAGVLIHDDNLALLQHILDVASRRDRRPAATG